MCNANYLILLCRYVFFIYVQLRSVRITDLRNYGYSEFIFCRKSKISFVSWLLSFVGEAPAKPNLMSKGKSHKSKGVFFGCRKSKVKRRKADSLIRLSQVFCRRSPSEALLVVRCQRSLSLVKVSFYCSLYSFFIFEISVCSYFYFGTCCVIAYYSSVRVCLQHAYCPHVIYTGFYSVL